MTSTVGRILIIASVFLLWELLPTVGVVNRTFLPPLSTVLQSLYGLIASGELLKHVLVSAKRVAAGLGIAILIGIPLGIMMGWFKDFEKTVDAPLQAGRQVSAIALFPVFILFFGIGELSKAAIIFWASVWPILLNTVGGVRGIDPVLIRCAESMGAKGGTLFRKVVLPAAAPSIFTGVRLGAAYAFMVLVAAEMVGANAGLGFLVLHSQEVFRIPEMYGAILALAAFGLCINNLLLLCERRATRWREVSAVR